MAHGMEMSSKPHWRNFFIRTRGTLPCPQIASRSWCHYRRNFEHAREEKKNPRRWVAADFLLIKKVCCSLAHENCSDKKKYSEHITYENQFADRRKVVYEKTFAFISWGFIIHTSWNVSKNNSNVMMIKK